MNTHYLISLRLSLTFPFITSKLFSYGACINYAFSKQHFNIIFLPLAFKYSLLPFFFFGLPLFFFNIAELEGHSSNFYSRT